MKKTIYITLVIGLLGYFLFYYQIDKLKILSPLKEGLSKEQIEKIAVEKLSLLSLDFESYRHKTEMISKRDYFNFISKEKKTVENAYKVVPSFAWQITWFLREEGFTTDEPGVVVTIDGETIKNNYIILDYRGHVLEFGYQGSKKGSPTGDLNNEEKQKLINKILTDFAQIDTLSTPLTLVEKSEAPKMTEVRFERINNIGIKEELSIRIRGEKLDSFKRKFLPSTIKTETEFNITIIFGISQGLSIFILIILALILFIKKAKRDELDFKRALGTGVFIFILFVILLFNNESQWEALLFGGLIGGAFVGGGFVLLYATSESINRDIWKEKLTCMDILFQGNFNVDKIGKETVLGISSGGIGALYLYLLLILSEKFKLLPIVIDDKILEQLTLKYPVIGALNNDIFMSIYLTTVIFLFLFSILRYKVKGLLPLIILGIIISPNFSNYLWISIDKILPFYIALLPIIIGLTVIYYKREFFTVLISIISFQILTENSIFLISPATSIMSNGYILIILFFILLILGIYAYERGKDVEEIEEYKPDYLERLAEKERFLRELEIARHIQSKFLPATKPKIKGISVSSMCVPAMEVGGDYYDFIEIDENRLGVIIGDVSGKGVSAAFYMTLTKGIVKTAAKSGLSPREMLINLNHIFYENVPRGVFISVIYGIFDFKERTLTFARAGHNPLILRKRTEAKTEMLHPEGLAVGLEKGDKFDVIIQEQTIGISRDDIFIFYTDGITESMNRKKEEFGEEKLITLVNENSQRGAEEVMNIIKYNLETFTGKTEQFDDQTMVIVKIEE